MKERICCVCRKRDLATNRIRIGRERLPVEQINPLPKAESNSPEYRYFIDYKGNANGRGCYVCHGCIDIAIKKRAFNRSFKGPVPNEVYEELAKLAK